MSKELHIESRLSDIFRTISTDYYEYWVEPEITRILFYTDHYFTRESKPFKDISKDDIWRELQVEMRMATSMSINLSIGILKKHKIRIECPTCKEIVDDLISHSQIHQEIQQQK